MMIKEKLFARLSNTVKFVMDIFDISQMPRNVNIAPLSTKISQA